MLNTTARRNWRWLTLFWRKPKTKIVGWFQHPDVWLLLHIVRNDIDVRRWSHTRRNLWNQEIKFKLVNICSCCTKRSRHGEKSECLIYLLPPHKLKFCCSWSWRFMLFTLTYHKNWYVNLNLESQRYLVLFYILTYTNNNDDRENLIHWSFNRSRHQYFLI